MDSLQRPDNALRPLSTLSKVYIAKKDLSQAEKQTKRLLKDAFEQDAKIYIRDAYKAMSDIAKLKNNFEDALAYY